MNQDPTDLAAQDREANDEIVSERERRNREVEDFKWLMSDARGRRFVWRILEKAGVYRSSFTGSSETFFREGRRDVGLWLMSEIHDHALEAYVRMMREQGKK
jgi:hypothetical protein